MSSGLNRGDQMPAIGGSLGSAVSCGVTPRVVILTVLGMDPFFTIRASRSTDAIQRRRNAMDMNQRTAPTALSVPDRTQLR
jgi:hypothetical protein